MMADRVMRGSRLGAMSYQIDHKHDLAPRQIARYRRETRVVGDSAPLSRHIKPAAVERCGGLQCNDFRHGDEFPPPPGCTKV